MWLLEARDGEGKTGRTEARPQQEGREGDEEARGFARVTTRREGWPRVHGVVETRRSPGCEVWSRNSDQLFANLTSHWMVPTVENSSRFRASRLVLSPSCETNVYGRSMKTRT